MAKVIVYHMPVHGFAMLRFDAEKAKAWTKENWLQYTKVLELETDKSGDDAAEEGLVVQRMSIVELCRPEKSPFSFYNRSAMMAWRNYNI